MAELIERIPMRPVMWLKTRTFRDFETDYEARLNREPQLNKRKTTKKELADYYSMLQKLCDSFMKTRGIMKRTYKYSLTTPTDMGGRLFCGGSIQGLACEYRSLLLRDTTTDIDMKNAHPVILKYICHKHKIRCPELDSYVAHRDDILEKWSNKGIGKTAYLENTNNDKYSGAVAGESPEVNAALRLYANENKTIQKQLLSVPDYASIVCSIPDEKHWNRNGSAMNRILCYYENKILGHCCHILNKRNIEISTYMFDGLLVYGNYYNDAGLLAEIEQYVESQMEGVGMKWAYKQHDTVHNVPDDFDDSVIDVWIPVEPLEIAKYIISKLTHKLLRKNGELFMFHNHQWIQGDDAKYALASFLYNTIYPDLLHQLKQKGGEHMEQNLSKINKYIQINQSSVIVMKVMENLPPSKQEFNTNPFLLGFNNGVLDLRATDNLVDAFRKAEPTDYITMSVGYDFIEPCVDNIPDAAEVKEELDQFFETSIPNEDDRQLLMEVLASSLDGIAYEKFFMFNGGGGNGKSVIVNLMAEVLGAYCVTAQKAGIKDFAKANESSGDLLDLRAKRMILFEELGDLNNNVIKNFTGGVSITARALYKSNETFKLSATTIASYNQRPDIINTTGGNSDLRRYVDLFFSVNFTGDEEKIGTTEEVGNQTITWAAANNKYSSGEWRGKVKLGMLFKLLFWYQRSFNTKTNSIDFNVPAEAVNRVAEFIDDQNHFHRIFHENYEIIPDSEPECESKTDNNSLKVVEVWRVISCDTSYIRLGSKEKKRYGRKAFDDWLGKVVDIFTDKSDFHKCVKGIRRR